MNNKNKEIIHKKIKLKNKNKIIKNNKIQAK
jgi:hypothetical protein